MASPLALSGNDLRVFIEAIGIQEPCHTILRWGSPLLSKFPHHVLWGEIEIARGGGEAVRGLRSRCRATVRSPSGLRQPRRCDGAYRETPSGPLLIYVPAVVMLIVLHTLIVLRNRSPVAGT